ncbi:MAG: hypothetical protein HY887_09385, partial [Deltaproteobacteria bacterium]|nr:hypothetical protein [Deltaproteobacteria bacterium]
SGDGTSKAAIARREGLSRARVTQIMYLLNLAPDIQQHILSMPEATKRHPITERKLRPISRLNGQKKQMDVFSAVLSRR